MASKDVLPIPNPIHKERWTNPMTGGPYYYDAGKNSWIFEPIEPGDTIGRPPFDPADGNIWVDRETQYLVYIYNEGQSFLTPDPGWVSMTTLKRPYDYMVIEIETDDSKLTPVEPINFVNYFSTGYMYFNSQDMDLKVWLGEVDEYDRPLGEGEWVSITQHSVVGHDVMKTPGTIAMMEQRVVDLTNEINALANEIITLTGVPLVVQPTVAPATAEAFALQGYYPLYSTAVNAINNSGDGTYHTHRINDVTYFMPNGLVMGVTQFHGDYGTQTADTTDTTDGYSGDSSSSSGSSSDSSSSTGSGSSGGYGY